MVTADKSDLTGNASVLGAAAVHNDKMVEVTLSTFLPALAAVRMGLKDQEFGPGDKVKVHLDDAASLVEQGAVAGVDPTDTAAVSKVLGIK